MTKIKKIKFPNGDVYEGEVRNGKPHGKGIMLGTDTKYVGVFEEGSPHGYGEVTYHDGTKEVATWSRHKKGYPFGHEGKNKTMIWPNGQKYIGEWLNQQQHGQGTCFYEDGIKYVGEWQYGERHGKGIMFFPDDRSKYEGMWFENKMHGEGKFTYADGSILEGIWHKGKHIEPVKSRKDN